MKRKNIIAGMILVALVLVIGYLFPVRRLNIHQRKCVAIVSRIYPVPQVGDMVVTKDGKVMEINEGKREHQTVGRVIFSTAEGIL